VPVSGDPEPVSPELAKALAALRHEVQRLVLPMETPGAATMRAERERVLRLLDDYLGQRLAKRDGPVLVVIGGPTGAGKSTLINSLVGARVSPSGVIRPTTAEPVLVYNPADGPTFFRRRLLPNVTPTTVGGRDPIDPNDERTPDTTAMRLVPSEDIAPGLALVDSPDFDSYQVANHHLAADLLDIADIWLYVTTGTDYARALPWDFLRVAAGRRLGVAAVINRMRPDEIPLVAPDLARLLNEQELGDTPMFVVPEIELFDDRIPVRYVEPLMRWLDAQAGSQAGRDYVGRAMAGTVERVLASVDHLAMAAADQVVADRRLRVDLRAVFRALREELADALGDLDLSSAPAPGAEERARSGSWWRRNRSAEPAAAGPADVFAAQVADLARGPAQLAVTRVAERWAVHPAAATIGLDRVLELPISFDDRVRSAARQWREENLIAGDAGSPALDGLLARVTVVLDEEEARLGGLIDEVPSSSAAGLREAGAALRKAWAN
jgi:energy-coupling factor transporter ATP-binding protein EcfA2